MFKEIKAEQGQFVIIASDKWFVFDQGSWREMTAEEQIEASK